MSEPVVHKLEVPGAVLCYDVRESEPAGAPVLVMIGSPMGAAGFGTLASHFSDRTIVTYDPRGVERSDRTDTDLEVTPEVHAADVRAVIEAVGGGPVDVFASSGGAVNALALVAAHPDLVRTLVAHEPPAASVLPDANDALAACRAVHETYQRHGWGAGMAHFVALISLRGPVPPDFATQPAPDPVMFGMPAEDDGTRDDLMLGSNILTVTRYRPDADRLRAASTRIVVAVGAESTGELAHRGGLAVAELLGTRPVTFPGGHGGFLGGEYGQTGEPVAFAARLREILTPSNRDIVRAAFEAYLAQDRDAEERLVADEFVFTSPQDDHIDRAAFFERCFPTVDRVRSQHILYLVDADDENVFITYEYELKSGGRHRNTELVTVRHGQLVETQVFFGGPVGPPAEALPRS